MVLEKTLESPLDYKEIKPVNPKGNQSWIFIGRTDAEAEALILWPPDAKNRLIGKDPDAGQEWMQEEKGMTEDEMIGWHELGQTLGDGEGQGSLACCSPWGCKESDMTERLSNNIIQFNLEFPKTKSAQPKNDVIKITEPHLLSKIWCNTQIPNLKFFCNEQRFRTI